MLNEIFSSVLPSGTAVFDLGSFLACTAASLLLGVLIAWAHAYQNPSNRGFLFTLVTLPAMVQTVIMLVNGSIGTGVAVMGAFSLIRFRSVPGGAGRLVASFWPWRLALQRVWDI